MAKPKNLMAGLMDLSGANTTYSDPHANIIRIGRSPSVGFTFGNGHGLPEGYTLMMYGPNKGGKTLLCNDTVGTLHADDPQAVAIKWDTEFRERLQMTPARMRMHGIDPERYVCWSTNTPSEVFDRFERDVAAKVEAGLRVRLAIIDSTSNIQGRREGNSDSIDNFQIGDHAMTLQVGLKRILPVIRRYNIALILVTHIRAEMDQTMVRRGNTVKPQASWAVKHFAEYFAYVERDDTKAGRVNELGEEMIDASLKDIRGDNAGEQTGHKIRFIMKESSAGPRGRQGAFSYDYAKGICNLHEEVFILAKARGIIENKGSFYSFGDRRWQGKPAALADLEKDTDLQAEILKELRKRDLEGAWSKDEAIDASVPDIGAIADAVPVT